MTLSSFFIVKNLIIPSQLKLRFDRDYTISRMNAAIWQKLNLLNNGNCSRHRYTVIDSLWLNPFTGDFTVTISDINGLFFSLPFGLFYTIIWMNAAIWQKLESLKNGTCPRHA